MYLPIVGLSGVLFLFAQSALPVNYGSKKLFYILIAVLTAGMGFQTFHRSRYLVTSRDLWSQALKVVPGNIIALNNLGLSYQTQGNFDQAIELYRTALRQQPDTGNVRFLIYNNLANIYSNPRFHGYSPRQSISILQRGIDSAKNVSHTYELRINLAQTYKQMGMKDQARSVIVNVLLDLSRENDLKFRATKAFAEKIFHSL